MERSVLSVPAANWRMIEKGAKSEADFAFLDLEDSVPTSEKVASRQLVIRAFRELDWGRKPRAYRVNGLETPFFYRDLIDVIEAVGDRIDMLLVPKVGRPEDLVVVDTLLTQIELGQGGPVGRIRLEAVIETAAGVLDVSRIVRSTPRLQAVVFGPGDYAASMKIPASSIGTADEWDAAYPGHRFHFPMVQIALAAHSAGIRAIDGPVANYRDLGGFRRSCLIARSLGYDGKWCIHPAQVPVAHEVFSPTPEEVTWAQRVIDAYNQAEAAGSGVASVDDKMIDTASVRIAEGVLESARATDVDRGSAS